MKQLKFLWYLILGFGLVLLDVSFLSNFDLYGASVITSFLALVILAISDHHDDYVYFALLLIILFAVFSSLPLGIIIINFLLLPVGLNLAVKKFFDYPNNFSAFFYFIVVTFVFDLVILIWSGSWNMAGFLALGYFVFINSAVGWAGYYIYSSIRKKFTLETEVKI